MCRFFSFHLHGDNIVECERTIALIRQALANITIAFEGPLLSPVCPSYLITIEIQGVFTLIICTLYPGFGRWNHDILELVRRRGGTLREAADVIITGVADKEETPLIAIEYCGALPAGNQAWQRSGRAFSFGKAQIPYLYIVELGGYELDLRRARKAPRLPNPAIPFSYVAFSMTNETFVLPVFVTAPGADETTRAAYGHVFAEVELLALVRAVILGQSYNALIDDLRLKTLLFVETKACKTKGRLTITQSQWQQAYKALQNDQSLVDFLVAYARLSWKKTTLIRTITPTARWLMDQSEPLAIGITSSQLPMCIIPKDKRNVFADCVEQLGKGRIQPDFLAWLRRDKHLSICWINGFKPKGDDARPDRGLAPFTRMLIGKDEDLLTIVYGPAPILTWEHLHNTPKNLVKNGLWEAIFEVSDAILVDSSTDDHIRQHGYLRSHWHQERAQPDLEMVFVEPAPLSIGENDVDTVLHLLLAHHAGSSVFEGMCNPPGGDWSGVSILTANKIDELRWLSLPRVSSFDAKRPDHVFQIFPQSQLPIILCVESKYTAVSVEPNIGPRLTRYIQNLISDPASVSRLVHTKIWTHSTIKLDANHFLMASAVAFNSDNDNQTARVRSRANADLLMSLTFENGGASCTIVLIPVTQIGKEIALFMQKIPLENTNISVVVDTD